MPKCAYTQLNAQKCLARRWKKKTFLKAGEPLRQKDKLAAHPCKEQSKTPAAGTQQSLWMRTIRDAALLPEPGWSQEKQFPSTPHTSTPAVNVSRGKL